MQTISATELTRNTREILDRVATRGETVTIERNHTMIAQIMPPQKPIPPRKTSLNLPMNYLLRDFWKYPTDQVPGI